MGSVAACFDNALAESLFATRRRHSSLGHISPAAFEARHTAQAAAA